MQAFKFDNVAYPCAQQERFPIVGDQQSPGKEQAERPFYSPPQSLCLHRGLPIVAPRVTAHIQKGVQP